jgi:hypothetical protein
MEVMVEVTLDLDLKMDILLVMEEEQVVAADNMEVRELHKLLLLV